MRAVAMAAGIAFVTSALTSDGIVMRTRALSAGFDDVRAESAVIGAKRFRAIAEGIDRSTLFDPPPKPSPGPGGFVAGPTMVSGLSEIVVADCHSGTAQPRVPSVYVTASMKS